MFLYSFCVFYIFQLCDIVSLSGYIPGFEYVDSLVTKFQEQEFIYLILGSSSTSLHNRSTSSWHTLDRVLQVSVEIAFQTSIVLVVNSSLDFASVSYFSRALLRCPHRFSMGLRSGDWAGQVIVS